MQSVTSKELKNRTGAVLARVRGGATIVVTNRGRRVAVISPAIAASGKEEMCSCEAWTEIEAALAATSPQHADWREAMRHTRGRS